MDQDLQDTDVAGSSKQIRGFLGLAVSTPIPNTRCATSMATTKRSTSVTVRLTRHTGKNLKIVCPCVALPKILVPPNPIYYMLYTSTHV